MPSEPDQSPVNQAQPPTRDGGPVYKETPLDPTLVRIAEPCNTITASFFILIVAVWFWRLRGRYRQYPFITCCMPILLIGGIGGTLYHALRTETIWMLMDVIPIGLLGGLGSSYLAIRLGKIYGLGWMLAAAVGLLGIYLVVNAFVLPLFEFPGNWKINLNYALLAVILLVPVAVVMVRTRFRDGAWIAGSLLSFGIAWFCRLMDNSPWVPVNAPWADLPMGTHWLWHTFGAITTCGIIEYFYRIEGKPLKS